MNFKVTGYAFTTHPMHLYLRGLAQKYILNNYNKTIFEFGGNLYDVKTLNNLVNLDCMNCHTAHKRLCCAGSPYPLETKEILRVNEIYDEVLKSTLNANEYNRKSEIINNIGLINEEGSVTTDCGNCMFFNEIEGSSSFGCSIHAYSLKNNISYTDLKLDGCLLYPIDILTLDNGGYFVFGLDESNALNLYSFENDSGLQYGIMSDNKGFSRWTQNDLKHLCVNLTKRSEFIASCKEDDFYKGDIPNEIYKVEKFKPLFIEEQESLEYLFGKEHLNFIYSKSIEIR
ncbi:hypothetical protein E8L90_17355 [Brevibacillus antibioticus]|uniref:Alphavirus-like MT domain-containing protein n=1 Tax=Brevibacillus antibioticus TaxID=2570228 RepID=A0A4U2YAV7_9BACL|nr:hypothetical protein [Brevibacillus antibioticus]TKI57092.1 hypothetical protein E8L90_17355 [Brevibacillus antibioticus]